jgi:dsRNA-specific ribonuclease
VGALFLDFNRVSIKDEEGWFQNMFMCGPGFQMAQKFIENIFEHHIDWIALIQNDDNYKNILQVKIQKEFKVTPHYLELQHDADSGYKMGVYLCMGQPIYHAKIEDAVHIDTLQRFEKVQEYIQIHGKLLLFLGEGQHKIKRKAEQIACYEALQKINQYV